MGSIPKPLKRLRFDGDGQDEADGRCGHTSDDVLAFTLFLKQKMSGIFAPSSVQSGLSVNCRYANIVQTSDSDTN